MDGEQPYPYQVQPDYADTLEPGYRFCPTDSELIVYYLKRKIESGEHPKCRLYEVNLYDYNPEHLAEQYRPCENKWYFLTLRERKYSKGDRPNRRTRNFGYWKTTQKYTTVYDDVNRQVVGKKRCLAYHDEKNRKTPWLMHEYTTNLPNFPIGSNDNKLTDWVLCKIYKKETNRTDNRIPVEQVEFTRIQENVIEQHNQHDQPSPRRQRLYVNYETNQLNEPCPVQILETNHYSGTGVQMVAPVGFTFNPNQQRVDYLDTLFIEEFATQRSSVNQNINDNHHAFVGGTNLDPNSMQPVTSTNDGLDEGPTLSTLTEDELLNEDEFNFLLNMEL